MELITEFENKCLLNNDCATAEDGAKLSNSKAKKLLNKQFKKERKLFIFFCQNFLPDFQNDFNAKQLNNTQLKFNRNLLVDNRDYKITLSSEQLITSIEKVLQINLECLIEDIFVIPSKTFILIRFCSIDVCQNFKNYLHENDFHGMNNFTSISDKIFDFVLQKFLPDVEQLINQFETKPPDLKVLDDFLFKDEERKLLKFTGECFSQNNQFSGKVSNLPNKPKLLHFGNVCDLSDHLQSNITVINKTLPVECNFILDRLMESRILTEIPDQLTISYYEADQKPNEQIPYQCDKHSMYTEVIATLVLGSDIVMNFVNPRQSESITNAQCLLKSCSILVMSGEARYLWRHGIQLTGVDIVPLRHHKSPPPSSCLSKLAHHRLSLQPRAQFYTFTFRKTRPSDYICRCPYAGSCDSQLSKSKDSTISLMSDDPTVAKQLECSYVHETYDQIAEHFSATRYGCWPSVVHFLNSLPCGSMVIDVGCGNGKYLHVNQSNIVSIGTDRSKNLLKICHQRGFETFLDDCLNVDRTLRWGLFDGVICIAVIHHLASEERRLQAIQSLANLLTAGGRALIYVWAFEQRRNGKPSKYLRQPSSSGAATTNVDHKNDSEIDSEKNRKEQTIKLKIHQNRSEFAQQDLFVPFSKNKTDQSETSLRYYHVFREGELERLIGKLPPNTVQVEQSYYDQGNWCCIMRRL